MKNAYLDLLNSKGWLILALYILSSFLLTFVDNELVTTDEVYVMYLDRMASEKYKDYDSYISDFEGDLEDLELDDEENIDFEAILIDLLFISLKYLFSVVIVSGILFGFLDLMVSQESFNFNGVYKPVLLGNFVFLLPTLISVIWFTVFQTDFEYEDLQGFRPLYLIGYLDKSDFPNWLYSLLSVVNLYDFLFVPLVAVGIRLSGFSLSFVQTLKYVAIGYFGLLITWEIIVIYILSILS